MSGRSVALAHRVARDLIAQRSVACAIVPVAVEARAMAGAAFLMPGLVNGYGKIEHTLRQQAEVLEGIEGRLSRIERTLSMCQAPLGPEALGIETPG